MVWYDHWDHGIMFEVDWFMESGIGFLFEYISITIIWPTELFFGVQWWIAWLELRNWCIKFKIKVKTSLFLKHKKVSYSLARCFIAEGKNRAFEAKKAEQKAETRMLLCRTVAKTKTVTALLTFRLSHAQLGKSLIGQTGAKKWLFTASFYI